MLAGRFDGHTDGCEGATSRPPATCAGPEFALAGDIYKKTYPFRIHWLYEFLKVTFLVRDPRR